MPFRIILIGVVVVASMCVSSTGNAAGAYAVGRGERGSWGGGARDAGSYADASRDALLHCANHGPNCSVVAYFSRKCFSLAIPPGTGGYFWATRDTVSEASQAAMQHCAASGRSCEIKVAMCDTRGLLPADALPPAPQVVPVPALPAPRLEDRLVELGTNTRAPSIDGRLLVLLAVGLIALFGVAAALRKQSFRVESDFASATRAAGRYDSEAARFRAMSRKLDAESDLAESLIKAKRTRAELDDIEKMFRD